ncbi:MAG TPA: DUF4349 domain-containing protein [Dehalococcoidia bacterium]|nr:DUF4349 domain-containing protein [Dehalococcoidia bacterium]
MRIFILFLAAAITVFVLACSAESNDLQDSASVADGEQALEFKSEADSFFTTAGATMATPAPALLAIGAPGPPGAAGGFGDDGRSSGSAMQTAQRKIISSASVSIQVEVVEDTINQVRAIAEGLGGFVEQLSSSGEPGHERANITVRVPQANFLTTLERIEDLGDVRSRNLGTEDVSAQFIDLEARLKASLGEEASLLSLLERAGVVSEVLAIERELFRVRADIERSQGQLNFLERRVELSTISVSLSLPEFEPGELPSAAMTISVSDVDGTVDGIKGFADSFKGKVQRVSLSVRDGKQEARLTLLVFSSEFDQALDFLVSQGQIQSKEVFEGSVQTGETKLVEEEPESRISILLVDKDDSGNAGKIGAIVGGVFGGIALLLLLYFLLFGNDRRFGRSL